jgi:hypothetical protein
VFSFLPIYLWFSEVLIILSPAPDNGGPTSKSILLLVEVSLRSPSPLSAYRTAASPVASYPNLNEINEEGNTNENNMDIEK